MLEWAVTLVKHFKMVTLHNTLNRMAHACNLRVCMVATSLRHQGCCRDSSLRAFVCPTPETGIFRPLELTFDIPVGYSLRSKLLTQSQRRIAVGTKLCQISVTLGFKHITLPALRFAKNQLQFVGVVFPNASTNSSALPPFGCCGVFVEPNSQLGHELYESINSPFRNRKYTKKHHRHGPDG